MTTRKTAISRQFPSGSFAAVPTGWEPIPMVSPMRWCKMRVGCSFIHEWVLSAAASFGTSHSATQSDPAGP